MPKKKIKLNQATQSYKIVIEVAAGDAVTPGMAGDEFMKVSIQGRDDLVPGSKEYNASLATDLYLTAGIYTANAVDNLEEFFGNAMELFKKATIMGGIKRLSERDILTLDDLLTKVLASLGRGEEPENKYSNIPNLNPDTAREMEELLRQKIPTDG